MSTSVSSEAKAKIEQERKQLGVVLIMNQALLSLFVTVEKSESVSNSKVCKKYLQINLKID